MQKAWRWISRLVVTAIFARTVISAFSVPWRWTLDQYIVAFLVLCAVPVLGVWAIIWQRTGVEGVKKDWALMRSRQKAAAPSGKTYLLYLLFWMAVAVGLIVVFNAVETH